MKLSVFHIPAIDAKAATDELNAFLSNHRVAGVEKQFVADGANSFWSVCVTCLEGAATPADQPRRKVDYKDILSETDFAVFARLRELRGGSWNNNGRNVRSANRNRNTPDNGNNNIGFRLSPARRVSGTGATDQILILSSVVCNRSEKQGPRYVSSAVDASAKACRRAAFFPAETP